jgi:DNA-binding NarL/FixJ family response regulator
VKQPVTAAPRQPTNLSDALCVGILATDPLRLIGLQAILQENLHLRTAVLAEGGLSRSCRPDAVVVDAGLNSNEILGESVARVRRLLPSAPVVVLARAGTPEVLEKAIAAGALGFLPETAGVEEIGSCIRSVLDGTPWLPAETEQVTLLSKALGRPDTNLSSRFTPKEREVLTWLTQGRSNREIAATMRIDEATVKAHLGRMLRKAKATNRVELTLRVLAEGA